MSEFPEKYCIDLYNYERFPVKEVFIGNIGIGSSHPIRVQSMTNLPATDVKNSVLQAKKIFDAGADFVRIATPSIMDLESLRVIKKQLNKDGYKKPLIADVHFNPRIAEEAAKIVEKVRINPGNYIDKKSNLKKTKYSDYEYNLEVEKIHEGLTPLINICKEHGTAIRIGSNHGSLSERILCKYGNTIEGMVESAMEYISIFVAENFDKLVVSMKASDVRTTVKSARLLNARMLEMSKVFPQHLGVTEAGEGEDGRVKSAIGIGSLLNDGIGDTIRVSLTENPENEIVFAKKLVSLFNKKRMDYHIIPQSDILSYNQYQNFSNTYTVSDFSDKVIVIDDIENTDSNADILFSKNISDFDSDKKYLIPYQKYKSLSSHFNVYPLIIRESEVQEAAKISKPFFVELKFVDFNNAVFSNLLENENVCFVLKTMTSFPAGEVRYVYNLLRNSGSKSPIILKYNLSGNDKESLIAEAGVFPGSALADSLLSGIWGIRSGKIDDFSKLSFDLLQSSGQRLSKAEIISCPCCGRTSFNLEKLTREVKKEFGKIKGVKIAIMGCLVNGPGEMADADFGCVGSKKNHVHIYQNKKIIFKNVHEKDAIEKLKKLVFEKS